ncbi:MAG: FAD/NAD(P)-binding protein [Crenarchaeota archaeon]|nr:FAD/NAD(P)-binding protein [Thermoproteota archaeon]MDW8033869.1 FAD/NAD(P)-binding protein [Nitrososphaerota archaeon]
MGLNPYLPRPVKIIRIKDETPDTKTITISPKPFEDFTPGQFAMVTVYGVGEAPFSICSSPSNDNLQFSIRKMGIVTTAIHEASPDDEIGIRGPYGKGWPLKEMENKDILLIGGGIGFAPLRPLLLYLLENRSRYGGIAVCYGARSPPLLMYRNEFEEWVERGIDLYLTVDIGEGDWKGNVGVVTTILNKPRLNKAETIVCICGPPMMIRFVLKRLVELDYPKDNIYASLESKMRCGIGKCGHCHFGGKHVCMDGPVFRYYEMMELPRGIAPF